MCVIRSLTHTPYWRARWPAWRCGCTLDRVALPAATWTDIDRLCEANAALAVVNAEGAALTPDDGGQTGDSPFVWTWTFTPVVTGTYACTFSADMLDTPVQRLVFAGGHDTYLPIVVKQ